MINQLCVAGLCVLIWGLAMIVVGGACFIFMQLYDEWKNLS